MKLYKATSEFKLNNVSYPGFPLLLNDDMELIYEVHHFLVHYCLVRGRVQSKNSWWRYGQDLYDYFGFLEKACLHWKHSMLNSQYSLIATYRDWSLSIGLSPRTINSRLRLISKFYVYALAKGWITELPYGVETIVVNKKKSFFAHLRSNSRPRPNVILKEQFKLFHILTEHEVKTLLSHKTFISQHLIYRLALQTGMRKSEILSFPNNCINDPKLHGLNASIRIRLDPSQMKTKGSRERDIDIPIGLYDRLWHYKIHDRNHLLLKNEMPEQDELFLNRYGEAYSENGSILNSELKKIIGRKEISLHSLRHTYATFKLHSLRQSQKFKGDPFVYIQDRLGHTSLLTTQVYLHYSDNLQGEIMTKYDDDIDHISFEADESL